MVSLLKQISIVVILMFSSDLIGQKVEFELSIPLLSYHTDNISDIENGFNKRYANSFIPQFRFTANYKRIVGGIEHYYFSEGTGIAELNEGQINNIRIRSFSLLAGYQLYSSNLLTLNAGSGITYHKPTLALYHDVNIHVWGGPPCYEDNELGALFWLTVNKQILNHWTIGINLRYNPMFKEFGFNKTSNCIIPHNHDRLNYFVSQLKIGYKF
jgi:hypothetical protein|tara:strand:+ start:878 stop:1516 length:639 start_codon:yes stop_codon:yes gene_type:complete